MGCDYYVHTVVVARFENKEEIELESWSDGKFLYFNDNDDDIDFEALLYSEMKQMEKTTDLYKNGTWQIRNKYRITQYQKRIHDLTQNKNMGLLLSVQRIQYATVRQ